jgi:hypothetical protein
MRLLDRILLNRLISMISGFILGVLKLIAPKTKEDIPSTPVKPNRRKRILPRPKAPKDE